jgi:hypothetical protein
MMRQCGKVPHQAALTPHQKKIKKIDGAGGMAVAVTFRVFSAKHCLTEFYLKA